jgi:hypothetical protein
MTRATSVVVDVRCQQRGRNIDLLRTPPVLATTLFTFHFCVFLEKLWRVQRRYFHGALVYFSPTYDSSKVSADG